MNTIDYLHTLVNIPSPTGHTQTIMRYVFNTVESLGYQATFTNKGAVIVEVKGRNDKQKRLVTAHLDTLGAMVKEIKANGRLKIDLIGGFSYHAIENENCIIHSSKKDYTGTILMHQSSVHVYKDARTAERNAQNMEVRIDEKVFSAKDTSALGIEVGDFISFDTRTIITESGFVKSRHLDDKISASILLSLLEKIQTEQITLANTTYFYFSNNEEIGYGGNSNIDPSVVEYLAVDMGAIGDGQLSDEYTVSICAKDSSGPYHEGFVKHLVELAKQNSIAYQKDIYPYYGSDASAAIRAGFDIKHALFGPGVESSHAYERSHIDSIKASEQLLYHYLMSDLVIG